jgi:hypothetical protein
LGYCKSPYPSLSLLPIFAETNRPANSILMFPNSGLAL